MKNGVHISFDVNVLAHVVLDERKIRMLVFEQMFDIRPVPGKEIVNAYDIVALSDEFVAQIGADKARSTRYHNARVFYRQGLAGVFPML